MSHQQLIDFKGNFLKIMVFSIIGLIIGFYLLEEVSSWEKRVLEPLGQVFYILLGCVFIAVSGIFIFLVVKAKFFPKKRKKKGSKPVFLEDVQKKKGKSSNSK